MEIGIVGLGRMGGNMARRLARGGVRVVAFDRSEAAREALRGETGVTLLASAEALLGELAAPRIAWLMLPAGAPTADALATLSGFATPGDIFVDGANAHYRDSMARAAHLEKRGFGFVDAGVSGGIWGLEEGYTLMLGGSATIVARLAPYARILAPAPERGWLHCGPAGAGHFAKMVHNGIEYGLMQAYAEGLALLHAKTEFSMNVAALAECWRHGSVVRSWLLDLTAGVLQRDASLAGVAPFVADSGEGRWSVHESVELGVPTPVISAALMARFTSQGKGDFAARMLAKMRAAFGGHSVREQVR